MTKGRSHKEAIDESMATPAQIAFAALQASARNFAGLDNARVLILQARCIRRHRYLELLEETQTEQLAIEPIRMGTIDDEAEAQLTPCDGLQQAA